MNTKIGLDMEIATYRKLVDSETAKLERYNEPISFENLHKFYAYSSEKPTQVNGITGKVINLSQTQWSKIEKDASSAKLNTQNINLKPIDITTTKLGTNPYYSGKMEYSDLVINSATFENDSTVKTSSW